MAPQLAWIGLGNMGSGMCKNLVEKGKLEKPLILYNRTTSRAEELCSKIGHSTVASSVEDAVAKADIIFLSLGDDAAVLENVEKVLAVGNLKGKVVADCSTIHPETSDLVGKKLEAHGVSFVACPVFGSAPMADAGQLICTLAGPADALEKVKPYCQGVMGRANIEFQDEPPSKAFLLKVIGNTFIQNMITILSEGHVLAEKTGLGTDNLHKFVETMFGGAYTVYSNRFLSGDYYKREKPLGAVDGARKDAGHAKELAKEVGMQLKCVELADEYLQKVQDHMGSRGDIAGIYGAKRVESGLRFELE